MNNEAGTISPKLAAALRTFHRFLLSDDIQRSDEIERSDKETLTALAGAVEPLLDEIDDVLDRLVAKPHPLPPAEDDFEVDLNSLGQAGIEARMELNSRFG
jgi:hypothetical protein